MTFKRGVPVVMVVPTIGGKHGAGRVVKDEDGYVTVRLDCGARVVCLRHELERQPVPQPKE